MDKILFRADASVKIGAGHIMRCLSIAQALQRVEGRAYFLSYMLPSALSDHIKNEQCDLLEMQFKPYGEEDALETVQQAATINANWIVLDGYNFTDPYCKVLKDNNLKIMAVDDYAHANHNFTDIVLNQNPYAKEEMYPNRGKSTKLLLGTKYVVMRNEFRPWISWKRDATGSSKKILITLGGTDPKNITGKLLQALAEVSSPIEAIAIIGGDNPNMEELKKIQDESSFAIEIAQNVTNMPELMSQTDVAISAGGSTCYELALMQVPTITIIWADNQERVGSSLEESGFSINAGRYESMNTEKILNDVAMLLENDDKRNSMAKAGKTLVDGTGANRVIMHMLDLQLK